MEVAAELSLHFVTWKIVSPRTTQKTLNISNTIQSIFIKFSPKSCTAGGRLIVVIDDHENVGQGQNLQ